MTWVLLALLLACKPDPDDTGDTGDTADTGDTDTDSGDTSDTADTAVCPDADGDGSCDAIDDCDGPGPDDADGDGTCDGEDPCFGAGADSDTDGVCDNLDECQGDDATGDLDADGTCDDSDACYGAGADGDGDGLCDDVDLCSGDNTTGDDDSDAVCDGGDPCVGPAWCWNLAFTITATPTGSAFDNLIGQTLSYALGVGDDGDWSTPSIAYTTPEVLSKTGSNAAAQTLVNSLATPQITMLPNGDVEVRMDPSSVCVNGETVLAFVATGTGWGYGSEEVQLSAGTPATTATLQRYATCPTVSENATGTASLVAIDGFGPP